MASGILHFFKATLYRQMTDPPKCGFWFIFFNTFDMGRSYIKKAGVN